MFLLPFGTNNPTRKFPYATVTIIIINLIVYMGGLRSGNYFEFIGNYGFVPGDPELLNLITHQFLHSPMGLHLHLVGNMLFLWLFGNNVEDLMGPAIFVPFYLACGICAGLLHWAFAIMGGSGDIPMIGASGAVFGITGAYFVLFPRSDVRVLLFIFIIPVTSFHLPALFFLGLQFAREIYYGLSSMQAGSGVAHWAHIGGFGFGAGILYLLILMRVIIVQNFDKVKKGEYASMSQEEIFSGRLASANEKKNFSHIPADYRALMLAEPHAVLEPERQMQIGRIVAKAEDYEMAVTAYRKMLEHYPENPLSHRACLNIARIAAFQARDAGTAVAYLRWIIDSETSGQINSEAQMLMRRLYRNNPPPPQQT